MRVCSISMKYFHFYQGIILSIYQMLSSRGYWKRYLTLCQQCHLHLAGQHQSMLLCIGKSLHATKIVIKIFKQKNMWIGHFCYKKVDWKFLPWSWLSDVSIFCSFSVGLCIIINVLFSKISSTGSSLQISTFEVDPEYCQFMVYTFP